MLVWGNASHAQGISAVVPTCGTPNTTYNVGENRPVTQDTTGKACVNASVSASITGFTPSGNYATLTATGSSARTALPSGSPPSVVVYNTGTTAVSCVLGNGSVTAVANEDIIQPSSWVEYTVGSNADLACIDQTGSASNVVVLSGGTGIAAGSGGGGGSSGGGTSSSFGSAFPATGTALGLNDGTNMQGLAGINYTGSKYAAAIEQIVGSAAVGATNGTYANLLQGNAVISATNGIYGNILQGNAVLSATNPIFAGITDATTGPAAVKAASTAPAATDKALVVAVSPNTGTAVGTALSGLNASLIQVGAFSSEQTKCTTTDTCWVAADLVGKLVTSPYANRENMARGTAAKTDTSAGTILSASGSASLKEYLTDIQCGRTDAGTTAIYVTLNDGASSILVLPNNGGGGGNNVHFGVPLVGAANTALTFTASSGVSTVYCNGQGFYGY